jgi:hypothetical protein
MRTGPENKIKKQIIKILDNHKIFHWCAAASAYGVKGVSDRLGMMPDGVLLAIEAKAPGKKPTALQLHFGEQVKKNRGYFFVVDGGESLAALETFLKTYRRNVIL